MKAGAVIVSLHDVAPPFTDTIRSQLALLKGAGIERCVLNVVPHWHGEHVLTDDSALVALLQAEAAAGNQIALHGLTHSPHGPLRGALLSRVRGQVFAPGAAEFLTVSEGEARRAVQVGQDILARAGLGHPSVFCPPGWLMTPDAVRGVLSAGISTIAGMFSVRRNGAVTWIPSMGHMGSGYEPGVRLLNGITWLSWARRSRVVSVYLHPQHFSEVEQEPLLAMLSDMIRSGWRTATYEELPDA